MINLLFSYMCKNNVLIGFFGYYMFILLFCGEYIKFIFIEVGVDVEWINK